MNENSGLIPVGKYKGQPIEVLAEDRTYTDWLIAQPWFRERYGNLYAVIINNFCQPSETPEHNALQARFLDDDFRVKFASIAVPRLWWFAKMDGEMADKAAMFFTSLPKKCSPYAYAFPRGYGSKSDALAAMTIPVFESKSGADVAYYAAAGIQVSIKEEIYPGPKWPEISFDMPLMVEVKPEVGDDYPAILRQMRRNGSKFLFTRAYSGSGVNEQTFFQFMESQGIKVVLESEVDAAEMIRIDDFDRQKFDDLIRFNSDLDAL